MQANRKMQLDKKLLPLLIGTLLAGCQTMGSNSQRLAEAGMGADPATSRHSFALPVLQAFKGGNATAQQRVVYEGVNALRAGDYAKASRIFNVALKMDVTRSELHLLNAVTYHLMAMDGDGGKYELAEEGYQLALKFDDTNWLAHYYYGLCSLDQRKYEAAQQQFAIAAAIENRDPDLLFDLAVASYYAHDPHIADGALRRIEQVDAVYAGQPKVLRAVALVRAALNDQQGANGVLEDLRRAVSADEALTVERRIADWGAFYKASLNTAPAPIQLAQGFPSGGGFGGSSGFPSGGGMGAPSYPGAPGGSGMGSYSGNAMQGGSPSSFVDDKMVVVDVVLIGTQEDNRNTYGINLLNGLKLQFGDPSSLAPAYSRGFTSTTTVTDGVAASTDTTSIVRNMRIPSVTYSLNIANAIDNQDEVIAKPSLVALAGQTSEFFSGVEISAAAVSGGAGDSISVQKEVGVKLTVRPDFLPDGKVRLQVSALRTFLTDPSTSVVFTYRLDTTKTNVTSNVVLKFGETLILSGLTEREVTHSSNGVPFLKDIPGLNMLFSENGKRDYQKSTLIMITPRRPVYAAQAPEDRKALLESMSEYERSVEKLEQRNKDWFQHRPAFDDIRQRLQRQDFFREFHSGDMKAERWDKRDSNPVRLSKALEKLI